MRPTSSHSLLLVSAPTHGSVDEVTWLQLHRRVQATARVLRQAGADGERVAVVAPQSLDYVVGFLSSICAGAVAVPLFRPDLPGHAAKLAAALSDSTPGCVITTPEQRDAVAQFCDMHRIPSKPRVTTLEDLALENSDVAPDDPFTLRPQDTAYLQYTSGSTKTPSGVQITNANLVANARQVMEAYDLHSDRNRAVGWLPLYHDMGLVVSILMPVVGRIHSVIMDPLAFVQQPVRWLRLLSQYSGAFAAAPNFAYEYCVQRVRPEDREDLSLGTIAALVNGSEPIRPETLSRFQAFFEPAGLKKTAMRPSYGLAEATVFVSASPAGEEPTVTVFSRTELARGTACVMEPTDEENVTRLVACGWPVNQDVALVDPLTLRRVEDGSVGEIWVSGPNVGSGYWGRPEESQDSFRAVIADDRFAESGWLRTGDLGVWHNKQLYVTGRIKDLVIIDGTNHYPQDIEVTVQEAHPALRPDHCAAFAVPSDDGEKLVVVAEHSRSRRQPRERRHGCHPCCPSSSQCGPRCRPA